MVSIFPPAKGATGLGGYSWDVNSMSFHSNQALVRSMPQDHKQSLKIKTHLIPMGWREVLSTEDEEATRSS